MQIINIYTGGIEVEGQGGCNRQISEAAAGVWLFPGCPVSSVDSLAAGVQTSRFTASA